MPRTCPSRHAPTVRGPLGCAAHCPNAAPVTQKPFGDFPLALTLRGRSSLLTDARLGWAIPRPAPTPNAHAVPPGYNKGGAGLNGGRGLPPTNVVSANLTDLVNPAHAQESARADALATLFPESDPSKLEVHPNPPQLKTKLLKHQLQGARHLQSSRLAAELLAQHSPGSFSKSTRSCPSTTSRSSCGRSARRAPSTMSQPARVASPRPS
jgi:hypothetical protein